MADTLLLRALKGQAKSINLSCKKLDKVPKIIGQIQTILQVDLKGNKLTHLPDELGHLTQVIHSLFKPHLVVSVSAFSW